MPRIFDNIDQQLLEALQYGINSAYGADFCVGYFNLRGWRLIADQMENFAGGDQQQCRVLIGMQKLPSTQLYEELKILKNPEDSISQKQIPNLKSLMLRELREQLMVGIPNSPDEKGLQQLRSQLLSGKVRVKLHLRYLLHAKLYLVYKSDCDQPIIGYLGSSNLTFSGLKNQGELNIDVCDHDATNKLQQWFSDRWNDRFCIDISQELADIIDESWATEKLSPPYYIYLKMAYHLSQEARDGLSRYAIPSEFKLFDFQEASVKIACHHVNRRGGVIIGDVVGLGKTMVGTAIARVLEEDLGYSTLIICPKNLVTMWESYRDTYGLRAKILSISMVEKELENVPARFRLVLIDESHNLRNRDGKRYAAIKEYVEQSGSRCILLTATPYNKTYLDLSAQLRLFVGEDEDLGIRPEELLRNTNFALQHPDISPRTLKAFENSEYSEDWQQLMSKYMVRRTRSFIRDNYAQLDREKNRKYLEFADGSRSYFPDRLPKTATFKLEENDPYAKLYSSEVVDIISNLNLPRYALGSYQLTISEGLLTTKEKDLLDGLSRAGRNLIGFCRTNLFKRLESSGYAFIESIERHILRNYIYLYAIESGLDIPIGTQDVDLFSATLNDEDTDSSLSNNLDIDNDDDPPQPPLTKGGVVAPLSKGGSRGDQDLGAENHHGVLMYMRTSDGVDALAYVDKNGNSVTQSQSRILRLARCELETKAIARHPNHFDLVDKGAKIIAQQQKKMAGGGKLGSPNSARAKTYTRLNGYIDHIKNDTPLLAQGQQWDNLLKAVEGIYNYPLRERAITRLNRQLRSGIRDQQLADLVLSLWEDQALFVTYEDQQIRDSQIICSLGLF